MTDYYVDGAVGNDANAGTAEGAGNAWATIGKAESVIGSGDHVYIKASAAYTEEVTLALSYGTSQTPPWYEGYTDTPGDGGRITWNAGTNYCVTDNFNTRNFRFFRNINFVGGVAAAAHISTGDYPMFINCTFSGASSDGVLTDNNAVFVGCSFFNNGRYGANSGNSPFFYKCAFYGNASSQMSNSASAIAIDCLFYNVPVDSALVPILASGQSNYSAYCGNTIVCEPTDAGDGINIFRAYPQAVYNNIFYECGGAGIGAGPGGTQGKSLIADKNLFYNCGEDIDVNFIDGGNNLTGQDPLFTDVANDDYTLTNDSPAIDAGLTTPLT